LVITKGLSKKIGDDKDDGDKKEGAGKSTTYANKSAHVELAMKMKQRD
jgi:DNA polymerase delta subunit 1